MTLKAKYIPYNLKFKFDAGTSRGVLREKLSHLLVIEEGGHLGIGEAGPLPGLSIDYVEGESERMKALVHQINHRSYSVDDTSVERLVDELVEEEYPSIRFALETALSGIVNQDPFLICKNSFSTEGSYIPINGLIWMGEADFMLNQIEKKLNDGFKCLKMKIGSIDFGTETGILKSIRDQFSASDLMLRVDANGAFSAGEALQKLHVLSEYDIHSIEQPIKQGQRADMKRLCEETPIPIALDEELIGVHSRQEKERLLKEVQPQYIIIKPTLVGGLASTKEWIDLAEQKAIGWWMTSALESNVGLNAIAQFTANYNTDMYQGLGTGQLFTNNFPSALALNSERLTYRREAELWDLSNLGEIF